MARKPASQTPVRSGLSTASMSAAPAASVSQGPRYRSTRPAAKAPARARPETSSSREYAVCDLCGEQLGRNAGSLPHGLAPHRSPRVGVSHLPAGGALRGLPAARLTVLPRAGAGRRCRSVYNRAAPQGAALLDERDDRRDDATARRVPRQASRHHSGLAHAPGRTLPARIPRPAREAELHRALPAARGGGRGHAPAARPLRSRRRHHLRRHPAAARGHGHRLSLRRPRRSGDRAHGALRRRSAGRARRRPADRRALRLRGAAPGGPRARRPRAADRLRRRALHPGQLRDRGRSLAPLRRSQEADAHRAGHLRAAHGSARRHRDRLPARPGRGRRPGAAALRLLGRRPLGPRTTSASRRRTAARCSKRCAATACR